MKIVKPSVRIFDVIDGQQVLKKLEYIGRICYQSRHKIGEDTAPKFVASLIKKGHESILEHYSFTAIFIVDRGISHEIVRHRLASYAQESTRYCQYDDEIMVIEPEIESEDWYEWTVSMDQAEICYQNMLFHGTSPQIARSVLPTCLKTELAMTANLREWRHFFRMRCSPAAHPSIRAVASKLLEEIRQKIPVVFDDLRCQND